MTNRDYIDYVMPCTHENRYGTVEELKSFIDTLQNTDKPFIQTCPSMNIRSQLDTINQSSERMGIVWMLYQNDKNFVMENIRVNIQKARE